MIKTEETSGRDAAGEQMLANLVELLAQKAASNEPFDLDAVCQRYPAYRDRLRDLVVAIRAMTRLAREAGSNNMLDGGSGPAR